ncbi:MAG TPA: L,D-transpeptidase family protein [Gaiellaceae bacterium]|nr:L,D-transpeptidase family protein [Gaiellaceae bacterium]
MGFRRNRLVLATLVIAVLIALAFGAAYAYARSHDDVIADGVHIGALDVGGLSTSVARERVARAYAPLQQPIALSYPGARLTVAPETSVDVDGVVARALAVNHRSWFVARAWKDLTGGDTKTSFQPRVHYSQAAVEGAIKTLQRRINRPPRPAAVVPSFAGLTLTKPRRGVIVAARQLRREIRTALVSPKASRQVSVPIVYPEPHMTLAALRRKYPSFITIDRGRFTLRVYSHLRFVKSYPIAVGQQGLETPAGLYHIQDKVVNPSWQVPLSSWAGSLAGQLIPPGPDDPLKARWMGIFNGAGIHGTDETSSIGHAFSHGCVRMTIPDVIDLYDRVQVGTPVYIGD